MQTLRLVPDLSTTGAKPDSWDAALRPTSFDDYTGQRDILTSLRTAVRAAKAGGWALDHGLMSGPPGLGKTTLAAVIAAELGARLVTTSAPSITHKGELATLLTSLEAGDVLFIDELHRLAVPLQEVLYSAMEDFRVDLFTAKGAKGGKAISVSLPRFTLLGATTHAGMLTGPMLDRFGFRWQLRPYDVSDMTTIVGRSAQLLGVALDADAAAEIARRSRGTPRIANRLLRRVRDHAMAAGLDGALVPAWYRASLRMPDGFPAIAIVNQPLAAAALDQLGVDAAGLDQADRAYLGALATAGAPMGIEAICVATGHPRSTLEDVVEPFLVQLGLVARTPRGRIATPAGLAHAVPA